MRGPNSEIRGRSHLKSIHCGQLNITLNVHYTIAEKFFNKTTIKKKNVTLKLNWMENLNNKKLN